MLYCGTYPVGLSGGVCWHGGEGLQATAISAPHAVAKNNRAESFLRHSAFGDDIAGSFDYRGNHVKT